MFTNIVLIILIIIVAIAIVYYVIKNKKEATVEAKVELDNKTYTLDMMKEFVKRRLDEITKINLYDIGLSEEELKRRKNKKYELKKALKGCTYGDVNDKKYVKELIFDLLAKEYGVDEANISNAIFACLKVLAVNRISRPILGRCSTNKYKLAIHDIKKDLPFFLENEIKHSLKRLVSSDFLRQPNSIPNNHF